MTFRKISFLAIIVLLANCSGTKLDDSDSSGYLIGGDVERLTAGALTLKNVSANQNKTEEVTISASGAFTFSSSYPSNADFNVTVTSHPDGHTCLVTAGVGITVNSNVDSIKVVCYGNTEHTIGGTLSGASVPITVRNKLPDGSFGPNLIIPANGPFSFPDKVANTKTYDVSIVTSGSDVCTLADESGQVLDADVTNVTVACTAGGGPSTYTIGGSVSGLTAGTLILQNDQLDAKILGADGPYNFSTQYSDAQAYSVTVTSQPAGVNCNIANAAGSIPTASVTNIDVTCAENTPPSLLSTAPLSGASDVAITTTITLNFSDNSGSMDALTITAQAADGACTGTIQLSLDGYTTCVGGVMSSASNPTFVFTPGASLAVGTPYSYRINTGVQDSNGNALPGTPYNYSFTTAAPPNLGGTLTGLAVAQSVKLRTNAQEVTLTGDGAYMFPAGFIASTAYSAYVLTQPTGQWCTLVNATGTHPGTPTLITNVDVTCSTIAPPSVALFSNTSFVDYNPVNPGSEASNVEITLNMMGYTVTPFTDTLAAGINTSITGKDAVVIPEQEIGSITATLGVPDEDEFDTYVDNGGTLILMGHSTYPPDFLNSVFGFTTTVTSCSLTSTLQPLEAAGTPFAGGPATIPYKSATYCLTISTMPAGSKTIYMYSTTGATVAQIPYDNGGKPGAGGTIIFFGWDYYDGYPNGPADEGWLTVLDRAVPNP